MSDSSLIVVSKLNKSVVDATGQLHILCDIDFSMNAHETVAIVGASGSGKSTLLAIMAGLDKPTSGNVRIFDSDLFSLKEDDRAAFRAKHLAFVFQSFQLLGSLTALENVMLPLELASDSHAKKTATDMMRRVGLLDRLHHYPKVLSGGEQQRVAL
ncbi:MAG: ATP-binding cassette domain-containing protein, partial [Limnohabitans sp.]|nr:ATP-binding cassette domain-containing protein [Limnohabitans sp.]